ncbi:hypothetical protein EAI_01716 [Harpegnathos saltator]|uniref:Uncharacterized protein n=1 Tax=Harpegnathos saltator TaxID=610380 RepID=E2B4V3_HARSA|nr:hypothetical protein EAI_01716 [Harpegnathos saltator]
MHDIEEASAEEVQHSRLHAKPFDIRFLLENYHVGSPGSCSSIGRDKANLRVRLDKEPVGSRSSELGSPGIGLRRRRNTGRTRTICSVCRRGNGWSADCGGSRDWGRSRALASVAYSVRDQDGSALIAGRQWISTPVGIPYRERTYWVAMGRRRNLGNGSSDWEMVRRRRRRRRREDMKEEKEETKREKKRVKKDGDEDVEVKAAVIERFKITLKERLWRYFTHKNTHHYIDVLQGIVHAYNHSRHSIIKMELASVTLENALIAREHMQQRYHHLDKFDRRNHSRGVTYKVGILVRVSRAKGVFEKGYEANWTEEIFRIHRILE